MCPTSVRFQRYTVHVMIIHSEKTDTFLLVSFKKTSGYVKQLKQTFYLESQSRQNINAVLKYFKTTKFTIEFPCFSFNLLFCSCIFLSFETNFQEHMCTGWLVVYYM